MRQVTPSVSRQVYRVPCNAAAGAPAWVEQYVPPPNGLRHCKRRDARENPENRTVLLERGWQAYPSTESHARNALFFLRVWLVLVCLSSDGRETFRVKVVPDRLSIIGPCRRWGDHDLTVGMVNEDSMIRTEM
jgi:hypothetical protein